MCGVYSKHNHQKAEGYGEEEGAVTWWDCGSPLYDAFEAAWVGHLIERHLRAFPIPSSSCGSEPFSVRSLSGSMPDDKDPSRQEVVEVVGHNNCFGFDETEGNKYTRKRRVAEDKTRKGRRLTHGFRSFWARLGLCQRNQ